MVVSFSKLKEKTWYKTNFWVRSWFCQFVGTKRTQNESLGGFGKTGQTVFVTLIYKKYQLKMFGAQ